MPYKSEAFVSVLTCETDILITKRNWESSIYKNQYLATFANSKNGVIQPQTEVLAAQFVTNLTQLILRM